MSSFEGNKSFPWIMRVVPRFVCPMRASVVGMHEVLIRDRPLALLVKACDHRLVYRIDTCGYGQLLDVVPIAKARERLGERAHRGICFDHRRIEASFLPLTSFALLSASKISANTSSKTCRSSRCRTRVSEE